MSQRLTTYYPQAEQAIDVLPIWYFEQSDWVPAEGQRLQVIGRGIDWGAWIIKDSHAGTRIDMHARKDGLIGINVPPLFEDQIDQRAYEAKLLTAHWCCLLYAHCKWRDKGQVLEGITALDGNRVHRYNADTPAWSGDYPAIPSLRDRVNSPKHSTAK